MDPHKVEMNAWALREQVAPDLFAHVDPSNFPTTTIPALALAAAGYQRDNPTGESISLALRHALFGEGRNIGELDVLDDIARGHDLDVADTTVVDVITDWQRGQRLGVQGSPHFFSADRNIFCPVLHISRDANGELQLKRVNEALEQFLAESFN